MNVWAWGLWVWKNFSFTKRTLKFSLIKSRQKLKVQWQLHFLWVSNLKDLQFLWISNLGILGRLMNATLYFFPPSCSLFQPLSLNQPPLRRRRRPKGRVIVASPSFSGRLSAKQYLQEMAASSEQESERASERAKGLRKWQSRVCDLRVPHLCPKGWGATILPGQLWKLGLSEKFKGSRTSENRKFYHFHRTATQTVYIKDTLQNLCFKYYHAIPRPFSARGGIHSLGSQLESRRELDKIGKHLGAYEPLHLPPSSFLTLTLAVFADLYALSRGAQTDDFTT